MSSLEERAARADLSNLIDALERKLNRGRELEANERANLVNVRNALVRACAEALLCNASPLDVMKMPAAAIATKYARDELGGR